MELTVTRVHPDAKAPTRSYKRDAGWDLYTSVRTTVAPHGVTDVPCGIRLNLPQGYWGMLVGRSSTSHSLGLMVITAVIDPDYNGPMFAQVVNLTGTSVVIEVGQRISQLVLVPVSNVREGNVRVLSEERFDAFIASHVGQRRASNGFGSSGK